MYKQYRKRGITEMRPYYPNESLEGVTVGEQYTPGPGGMIARDPENIMDQWYISKEYFEANYEEVSK